MQNKSFFRRTLLMGVGAFALGGVTVGALSSAGFAQDGEAPQEARPQLLAPNANLIQQLSFADLVEEVSPAVVSIRTEAKVPARRRMSIPPEFERMLPPEFRNRGGDDEDDNGGIARGEGSGFFVDNKGHIVTNNHVVDGADSISVVLNNGDELEATLVGTDPSTDLAVLRVKPSGKQKFVRFSNDADLRVGDYVLAVGNPFGLGGSVTSGIVSAIGRENRGATPYADFIQIDASINRGNSGGPTFDLKGNVVGVNTAIISPTGGNVGIGLAVPSDVASDIVNQLISDGVVTRGWLGVSIGDLDDRLAAAVGMEEPTGALVAGVTEDSPAERAGFKEGDVVLEFDRKPIDSSAGLTRAVGALPPGKVVKAKVLRDGKEQNLTVTLAKRDPYEARQAGTGGESSGESASPKDHEMEDLGISFSSLTAEEREQMGFDDNVEGVLVTNVEAGSEAADAGIRRGMVITRADNKPVSSPKDIEKAVNAAKQRNKEAVLIRVQTPQRGGYFLALPVLGADHG